MRTKASTMLWNLHRGMAFLVSGLLLSGLWIAPASADSVSASGTWRSSRNADKDGTWQLAASKSAASDELEGSVSVAGQPNFNQGAVHGSFGQSGQISFGIVYNDVEESVFTGNVVGGTVSGTYTTKDGDEGTWTGSVGP
jgi:hypothetical protein